MGDNVADGLGGCQSVRDGGEGGASVCAAVEGTGGRAGVEDGVVALVRGDDGARGERGDGGEGALVLRADDAGGARRPNDGVGVGRVGDRAAALGGVGAAVSVPRGAAVRGYGHLLRAGAGADAHHVGGLVAGVVDVGGAGPLGRHPGRLGRGAEVGAGLEGEAAVVTDSREKLRATGGGGETEDSHFFDANGQGLDGHVVDGVPLGQVVAAIDSETGGVEPMVAVEGVDLEGFNHPAEMLGILREEAGLDPGSVRGLIVDKLV